MRATTSAGKRWIAEKQNKLLVHPGSTEIFPKTSHLKLPLLLAEPPESDLPTLQHSAWSHLCHLDHLPPQLLTLSSHPPARTTQISAAQFPASSCILAALPHSRPLAPSL